jgi:hypothetical protein
VCNQSHFTPQATKVCFLLRLLISSRFKIENVDNLDPKWQTQTLSHPSKQDLGNRFEHGLQKVSFLRTIDTKNAYFEVTKNTR